MKFLLFSIYLMQKKHNKLCLYQRENLKNKKIGQDFFTPSDLSDLSDYLNQSFMVMIRSITGAMRLAIM